jgi:hypothetical protein
MHAAKEGIIFSLILVPVVTGTPRLLPLYPKIVIDDTKKSTQDNPRLGYVQQIMKVGISAGRLILYITGIWVPVENAGLGRAFCSLRKPSAQNKRYCRPSRVCDGKLAVKATGFRVIGYREQTAGKIVYRQDNRGAAKRIRSRFSLILRIDAFLDVPNWWRPEHLVTGFLSSYQGPDGIP